MKSEYYKSCFVSLSRPRGLAKTSLVPGFKFEPVARPGVSALVGLGLVLVVGINKLGAGALSRMND